MGSRTPEFNTLQISLWTRIAENKWNGHTAKQTQISTIDSQFQKDEDKHSNTKFEPIVFHV